MQQEFEIRSFRLETLRDFHRINPYVILGDVVFFSVKAHLFQPGVEPGGVAIQTTFDRLERIRTIEDVA